jgi:hypothetical protein
LCAHDTKRLPSAEEGAGEVDLHNGLPLIECDLVGVSRRSTHAGVIEQQIDPAMSGDRAVEQVAYGALISYVGWDGINLEVRVRSRKII